MSRIVSWLVILSSHNWRTRSSVSLVKMSSYKHCLNKAYSRPTKKGYLHIRWKIKVIYVWNANYKEGKRILYHKLEKLASFSVSSPLEWKKEVFKNLSFKSWQYRSFSLSRSKKINWKSSSGRSQENEML